MLINPPSLQLACNKPSVLTNADSSGNNSPIVTENCNFVECYVTHFTDLLIDLTYKTFIERTKKKKSHNQVDRMAKNNNNNK